ncbi:hypothetical protein EVAR_66845_1 [Eumeta japonica]|uniref:Uncharacterized protein n=1 Tax=Eumeta variegata TaxID=151549 RepID=A0A4C1ZD41_EUMVA|nr:hypothetical protein EVAR_66845_1 [Eumeta japonica]
MADGSLMVCKRHALAHETDLKVAKEAIEKNVPDVPFSYSTHLVRTVVEYQRRSIESSDRPNELKHCRVYLINYYRSAHGPPGGGVGT